MKISNLNPNRLLIATIGLIFGTFIMLSTALVEEVPNDSTENGVPCSGNKIVVRKGCGGSTSTYYYDPLIYSNGNGLVFITRKDPPTMSSYYYSGHYGTTSNPTNAGTSSINNYKLWAYPAHGYKFSSWDYDSDLVTPQTKTGQGDVTTIKSNSTDKGSPTQTKIYANFAKDENELQVVLQRPALGSISVKSTFYNIGNVNGSTKFVEDTETVTSYSTDLKATDTLIHYSSDKLVLTASDASAFSGWYSVTGTTKTLLSNESTYDVGTNFSSSITICAEYNIGNFKVGANTYENIDDAISVANNGSEKTIVLLKDYTMMQNCTIPEGVTLLVPNDDAYGVYITAPNSEHAYKTTIAGSANYDRSSVFRTLTLAKDVTLTINGSLNVGGFRWCTSGIGSYAGNTIPETTGNYRLDQGYGLIDMNENSSIILNSGATLCCWGRIRGDGTITANDGSTVRECWVNTDYREADAYRYLAEYSDCFPMNQYYIQDIQVATTFKAGAKEILTAGMYFEKTDPVYSGEVSWIGSSSSFFELVGDAYITKYYDVETDRIVYNIYNGVTIDFAELTVKYQGIPYTFSTQQKIFDITNNCTFNVQSGKTSIKNDLVLAAGAELYINQEAEVEVAEHVSLYVFDKDDWGNFACMKKIVPLFLPQYELSETGANYYATHGITPLDVNSGYATYKMLRTEENLTDAKITVNGKLTVKGGTNNMDFHFMSGLYTTNAGAQIVSEKNGKIVFEQGLGTQTQVSQLWNAGRGPATATTSNAVQTGEKAANYQITQVAVTPAKLLNGNGKYLETDEFTEPTIFEYIDGAWGVKKLIKEIDINELQTIVVELNDNAEEVTSTKDPLSYTIPSGSVVETTGTISIGNGSTLVVEENASINANTLALNTTPSYSDDDNNMGISSQITGDGTFTATNVYIDIKMDPEKLNASNYYAFAVPFNVSAQAGENGVQKLDKDGNVSNATIDVDYRAYYYDGATRAQNGSNGSAWVAVTSADTYQPGKFYLIEFASDKYNVYRFHKITDEKLDNTKDIDLNIYDNPISDGDNGWCGIANNSLQNTKLEIEGVEAVQVLNPTDNTFTPVMLADATFAVGTPMFAQVTGETSATHTSTQASPERRFAAQVEDKTYGHYTIRIAAEGATKKTDQMFISASENANDSYTVGKDLAKMFMGQASVAQLWINRYGKKLAMSQTNLIDDVAEASLTLYAPKAGKYQVYLKTVPEDATLYLLEDGAAVANLNDGACVVSLSKGENDQFGLRINAIKTIPGVVTSIDEAFVGKDLQKVLLDGVVYIVREGKLYNALGQQVK